MWERVENRRTCREDVASARAKEGSEEIRRSWSLRRSRAAECRDFALRDWTERSPTGIAKIEACTCPARKGRVLYSSSRFSYSFFVSSFSSSLCASALRRSACPSKFLVTFAFLLSFLEIRSSSFSSRSFRHASLSLSLFLGFFWTELCGILLFFMCDASLRVALHLLASARCLAVHAAMLFPSTHATNAVSRLAHVGHLMLNFQ